MAGTRVRCLSAHAMSMPFGLVRACRSGPAGNAAPTLFDSCSLPYACPRGPQPTRQGLQSSEPLLGVEGRKESVLQRVVLGRLAKVVVHLARRSAENRTNRPTLE